MSEDAYAEALKRVERPPAPAREPEEPEMPPVSTAAATRVVYIERFVDPPNPYLPSVPGTEVWEDPILESKDMRLKTTS
mgnify:CR=1 FL=1